MCQFCQQHGEGRIWYLNARNYAEELLADLVRRRYLVDFVNTIANGDVSNTFATFRRASKAPRWLRQMIYSYYEMKYRRDHFGQVVPLEDLSMIFSLASSIVRIPCICRKHTLGEPRAEYCFGLGLDPEKLPDLKEAFLASFRGGPQEKIFDKLTPAEALDFHESFEKKGMIHTIWTFKTPFIGAVCNCDRADCLAMISHRHDFRLFFKSEYLALIDDEKCIGCRSCFSQCQFGAIGFSIVNQSCFIDHLKCHGCGICRRVCEQNAIVLVPRKQ